jgi:hypothetical protein
MGMSGMGGMGGVGGTVWVDTVWGDYVCLVWVWVWVWVWLWLWLWGPGVNDGMWSRSSWCSKVEIIPERAFATRGYKVRRLIRSMGHDRPQSGDKTWICVPATSHRNTTNSDYLSSNILHQAGHNPMSTSPLRLSSVFGIVLFSTGRYKYM